MELSPDWVVGFTDGEGCFYIGIYRHPEMSVGYQVLPEFRIVQHKRDVQLLHAIKRFFKCGVIRVNRDDRMELRIRKLECLRMVVDFFQKHPLKTKKNVDFRKFAKVIRWMGKGKHLNTDGVIEIAKIALETNTGNHVEIEKIITELKSG